MCCGDDDHCDDSYIFRHAGQRSPHLTVMHDSSILIRVLKNLFSSLVLLCAGKTSDAMIQYARALEIQPKHGIALRNLIQIMESNKRIPAGGSEGSPSS